MTVPIILIGFLSKKKDTIFLTEMLFSWSLKICVSVFLPIACLHGCICCTHSFCFLPSIFCHVVSLPCPISNSNQFRVLTSMGKEGKKVAQELIPVLLLL